MGIKDQGNPRKCVLNSFEDLGHVSSVVGLGGLGFQGLGNK